MKKHVEAGSALYSDALLSYEGLDGDYAHQVIDHAVAYVDGQVHTNGLENFWSSTQTIYRRDLRERRAFSSVSLSRRTSLPLQQSQDEDGEPLNDFDRFKIAMSQVVGKRFTWDALTGKASDPPSVN